MGGNSFSREAIQASIDSHIGNRDPWCFDREDLYDRYSMTMYQKNTDGVLAEIVAEPELLAPSSDELKPKWIHTGLWTFRMRTTDNMTDSAGVEKHTAPTELSCAGLLNPVSWFPSGSLTAASRWLNDMRKNSGGKRKLALPRIKFIAS